MRPDNGKPLDSEWEDLVRNRFGQTRSGLSGVRNREALTFDGVLRIASADNLEESFRAMGYRKFIYAAIRRDDARFVMRIGETRLSQRGRILFDDGTVELLFWKDYEENHAGE